MKNKILSLGFAALLGTVLSGCVKDDTGDQFQVPVALESFTTVESDMLTRDFDGIDENDPTMSILPARLMAGQIMTVTIDGSSAEYNFDGAKWVPQSKQLFFPGYGRSSIELRLSYPGEAVQDGSKTALMIADALGYRNESQIPARQLEDIVLQHLDALLEVELVDGLTADEGTSVAIDEGITAYNVPRTAIYQAVIEPGIESLTISLTNNGRRLSLDIPKAHSTTDGEFKENYRYRIKVNIDDTDHQLQLAAMSVTRWKETAEGSGGKLYQMPLRFPGKANTKVQINLQSGMTRIVALDQNGEGSFAGVGGDLIESVAVAIGEVIPVGRFVGAEPLTLAFGPDNSVQLREEEGCIMINSFVELAMLSSDVEAMNKCVKLAADIDLMNIEWDPIGNYVFEGSPDNIEFAGMFDGQGHNLYNLQVTARQRYSALFEANRGTIQNVNLMSGTVTADGANGFSYAAGICSQNNGMIMACTNHATIRGANYIGGVVAQTSGNVIKCENYGKIISSGGSVGGVIGNGFDPSNKLNIVLNINHGEVKGAVATGGIVGMTIGCIVAQCENYGSVSGEATTEADGSEIGGIAGRLNSGEVQSCTNEGKISGTSNVGGIAGYNAYSVINHATNNGEIESPGTYVGGIVGHNSYPVYYSINTGNVTGNSQVGGITGAFEAPVENCYSTGDVSGNEAVGGVAGNGLGAWLKSSFNYGRVTGSGDRPLAIGGVIGMSNVATVMGCANKGEVASTGNFVGGVIGSCTVAITGCYNQGNVSSEGTYIGGVAGSIWLSGNGKGSMRACYSTGEVSGVDPGSLAGNAEEGSALLECYYKDGTPIGVNNTSSATDLSYAQFGVDGWPANDPAKGWGVGTTENPEQGYWWSSLGDATIPEYPVLRDEPVF